MRGQSNFVGYMMTVLFSVLVLASISALIYTFYRAALEKEATSELTQIAIQVKDSLVKVYDIGKNSNVRPGNFSSVLLTELDLNLPDNVANLNYEVNLITANPLYAYVTQVAIDDVNVSAVRNNPVAKIIAVTTQDPIVKVEFDIPNIDFTVQGKSRNGLDDMLRLYKHNENSTVYNTVILGQPDIIIRVTSVS